jgi:hypothetical protein
MRPAITDATVDALDTQMAHNEQVTEGRNKQSSTEKHWENANG